MCSHWRGSSLSLWGRSDPRVLSGGSHRAFPLTEEAPEQHDLTDADDEQQDGFSDGPVGHPLEEMLRFCAVMRLSQPLPCLRVSHHLQDLMNGGARRLQLQVERSARFNHEHSNIQRGVEVRVRMLYVNSMCVNVCCIQYSTVYTIHS